MLLVVFSVAVMVHGPDAVRTASPDLPIATDILVERCAQRLDALINHTIGGHGERRRRSRWLSEDLDAFLVDTGMCRKRRDSVVLKE